MSKTNVNHNPPPSSPTLSNSLYIILLRHELPSLTQTKLPLPLSLSFHLALSVALPLAFLLLLISSKSLHSSITTPHLAARSITLISLSTPRTLSMQLRYSHISLHSPWFFLPFLSQLPSIILWFDCFTPTIYLSLIDALLTSLIFPTPNPISPLPNYLAYRLSLIYTSSPLTHNHLNIYSYLVSTNLIVL